MILLYMYTYGSSVVSVTAESNGAMEHILEIYLKQKPRDETVTSITSLTMDQQ